ncbi:hypothetical protein TYRP_009566 [Tyrophagus putrescentiae]|nr:hypothetical protein TYRP_009566 [Tyrophagus putrescentiae]
MSEFLAILHHLNFISSLLITTTTTTITASPTTTFTQIPFITNTTTTTTFQTPSQPLLNSHCLTTADCHNVTTFSRCYSGQCICSLGYQLFPSSACDPGSGRCVCDYFHSLHAPSQTCSEVNALDWAIFLVFAAFLFGSVAFIVGVFFKVTLVDGLLGLVSLKKRSGYSGIN